MLPLYVLAIDLPLVLIFRGRCCELQCRTLAIHVISHLRNSRVDQTKFGLSTKMHNSISEIKNDFEYAAWWYNLIGVKIVMVQNAGLT